jgi:hypothetical protein
MISRFFKKKTSSSPKLRKVVKIEKAKPKRQAPQPKILTAEGWKRMMLRSHKKS